MDMDKMLEYCKTTYFEYLSHIEDYDKNLTMIGILSIEIDYITSMLTYAGFDTAKQFYLWYTEYKGGKAKC